MGDRGPSPLRPPTTPFRVESLISPIDRELHPVIHAGRVAVITGAASGIGRAAARELARRVFSQLLAGGGEEMWGEVPPRWQSKTS